MRLTFASMKAILLLENEKDVAYDKWQPSTCKKLTLYTKSPNKNAVRLAEKLEHSSPRIITTRAVVTEIGDALSSLARRSATTKTGCAMCKTHVYPLQIPRRPQGAFWIGFAALPAPEPQWKTTPILGRKRTLNSTNISIHT